ncbi:hypothetical protein MPL3356_310042 [Mesorhizobium plurifarium]|uniref:Uncharacterized protein n=1 Tax=Mesorhizobium plurifarium TaxID=69974 RepID=A0A090E0B2_MESPL|nr:hypothetical protein MPL3356_310042 [Mesorhizobium plurifarium]
MAHFSIGLTEHRHRQSGAVRPSGDRRGRRQDNVRPSFLVCISPHPPERIPFVRWRQAEVEIDWRAHLDPCARSVVSTITSGTPLEQSLTA